MKRHPFDCPHNFKVVTDTRQIYLFAPTLEVKYRWVEAISRYIKIAKTLKQRRLNSKKAKSYEDENELEVQPEFLYNLTREN